MKSEFKLILIAFSIMIALSTSGYAQSYAGVGMSSLQFENASLKNEQLYLKNHTDNLLGFNFRFSQVIQGENSDYMLSAQLGYGEHNTYLVEGTTPKSLEEQIIELPVALHYYFLTRAEDRIAFTFSAGAYSSYVISRLYEGSDNSNLKNFRFGLLSDVSLQFNVTENESIKAATGFRYKIDLDAYKDNPGSSPAYRGGGFFLSIIGRL